MTWMSFPRRDEKCALKKKSAISRFFFASAGWDVEIWWVVVDIGGGSRGGVGRWTKKVGFFTWFFFLFCLFFLTRSHRWRVRCHNSSKVHNGENGPSFFFFLSTGPRDLLRRAGDNPSLFHRPVSSDSSFPSISPIPSQ
ncbi:hypothetical protein QBC38DRAFT_162366 [Podospora fimiseda]|uniref:Transmembrane protein n=1 Tax=Podospora fimiseda TaxID=252190 RepID=A0AAN7BRS6_9PEZI|nr:hypothetical protein QBC38DRAFT_162366 [Podospora fimiseda]